MGMDDEPRTLLSEMWDEDELSLCPVCGQKRLTPPAIGMGPFRICLDCGAISDPDDRLLAQR